MLYRLKFLRAAEGDASGGNGGGAAPPPAPDGAPPAATTTPDLTATLGNLGEALRALRTEFVDFRREARKPTPATTSPPAPVVPTAATGWGADQRLRFRDAIEGAGLTLSVERRSILEELAQARGVSEGYDAWAMRQAEIFGWKKPSTDAPTPPTPPAPVVPPPVAATAPVNPGAPAGTQSGGNVLPDDFSMIPQSVVDQMSPAEARAHYDRVMSKQRGGHPFAGRREAEKANQNPTAALASALKEVMGQHRK